VRPRTTADEEVFDANRVDSGLGAMSALAGPLNKAWVAADAKWVVHIDVEAAMGSLWAICIAEHQGELDIKRSRSSRSRPGWMRSRTSRG